MLLTLVPDPLRWSVGGTHADSGKTSFELSFRASTPSDALPPGISQHSFGRYRQNIRNRALTRTTTLGNWPDQLHVDRVHLQMTGNANGPGQTARCEPLPEWRAQPVPRICEHTAEADTGRNHAVDLSERDLRLRSCSPMFGRNTNPLQTCLSLVQFSGRKRRRATATGTSPRASVSDTSVWQLAVLPNAEAYCALTPTECLPFFGIAVSSITNTASLPPTSLSA